MVVVVVVEPPSSLGGGGGSGGGGGPPSQAEEPGPLPAALPTALTLALGNAGQQGRTRQPPEPGGGKLLFGGRELPAHVGPAVPALSDGPGVPVDPGQRGHSVDQILQSNGLLGVPSTGAKLHSKGPSLLHASSASGSGINALATVYPTPPGGPIYEWIENVWMNGVTLETSCAWWRASPPGSGCWRCTPSGFRGRSRGG